MKRVLGALVTSAATAAAVASAAPAASPAHRLCGDARGKTLAHSARARVYSLNGTAYGCANPNGRAFKLGSLRSCLAGSLAGPFAVAGRDAAYGLETCGIDSGTAVADVVNLSSGKILHSDPAASQGFVEGHQDVASIVVKSDGSDAWIGQATSIISTKRALEVFKDDKGGPKRLDSGLSIALRSLRLHRSRVTWTHGAATRSAALN
jgi:hypothetical protein